MQAGCSVLQYGLASLDNALPAVLHSRFMYALSDCRPSFWTNLGHWWPRATACLSAR